MRLILDDRVIETLTQMLSIEKNALIAVLKRIGAKETPKTFPFNPISKVGGYRGTRRTLNLKGE